MSGLSHTLIQVPPGVQCFVGEEARRRRWIEARVVSVFEGWDYEEIIPPLYDYADVFTDRALASKVCSFVGRDGSLLALRPDFTSLLAKIAAGRLAGRPAPLRLYYTGEVLRQEQPKAGRQSELFQVGLERVGGGRVEADVEVLAVAAECLERLGVEDWVLALGHAGVIGGLLEQAQLAGPAAELLRDRVSSKDTAGVREVLAADGVTGAVAEAFVEVTSLSGDGELLERAAAVVAFVPPARQAVEELRTIVESLRAAGLGSRLAIDLGEARDLDYYTGLVLRIYARGLGFEVGGGGRYDTLLGRFGRPAPAVGFSLGLDRVALLRERQGGCAMPQETSVLSVTADDLGTRLARARAHRAAGARIRFGSQP